MPEVLRFYDIVLLALHTVETELHAKGMKKDSAYWIVLNAWREQLEELLKDVDDEM